MNPSTSVCQFCRRALLVAWGVAPVAAAEAAPADEELAVRSLAGMSIEQLLDESVTSVSRREARWMDTPAATTVLTNEEIRRSGATTLVEALRMVPGMSVGAVNSSQSAVSARGFGSLYSNKMLVQIDGRTIYQPIFAGVFWDLQQTMLNDVERIEVIRGPGSSVWGANAVNGVISVVSRSARDTQGGLFYGGGGDPHELAAGVRYGGEMGEDTYYRVFGSYRVEDDFLLPNGRSADDGWDGGHGGFRVDHYRDAATHITWQADATRVSFDDGTSEAYNMNSLFRWTRQLDERSAVEVQAFFDRVSRDDTLRAKASVNTYDLNAQHSFGLGNAHHIVWGLGYRFQNNELRQTNPLLIVRNGHFHNNLFSSFVQDEYELVPDRFKITTGLRVEHNDYTGVELQPSLRTLFTLSPDQTVWTAVSRAVRTPSALEGKDALGFVFGPPFAGPGGSPYVPLVVGNGDPGAEVLWAYEAGYRFRPASWATVDVAAFYNRYSDIIGVGTIRRFVPAAPVGSAEVPMANEIRGSTYGGEVALTVQPSDHWRLTASYSLLLGDFDGPPNSNAAAINDSLETHKVAVRSSHDLTERTSFDLQLRYVDGLRGIPSYLTADMRLAYRPHPDVELSLVGQNLLDRRHPETTGQFLMPDTEIPRGFYARIDWNF